MIQIKDSDEKKMIIAYQKSCSHKTQRNLLCNSSVYSEWLLRWRDDFVVGGRCLKMWHQKFVVSANKHKQGIEPPEFYKEYNEFMNAVTDWINCNREMKQGMKNNKRKFGEILMEHRKNCADTVMFKLRECKNLSSCELTYVLPNKTDKKFTELVKYSLIYEGKEIFKGSFDETVGYIENINGSTAASSNR